MPNQFRAMCEDTKEADRNRKRVKENYCGEFYEQQRRAVEQCPLDRPLPDSVITGNLPMANLDKTYRPMMGLRLWIEGE